MAYKRKRRKTQGKYIIRRIFLALLAIGLIGGAGWLIGNNLLAPPDKEEVPQKTESSQPEVSAPQEPVASQPEPEPEEEPVVHNPDDEWQLILASALSPLPAGYGPPELETIAPGYQVDSRIAPALKRMIAEAKIEGINLMICSAYRSEERQRELHERKIAEHVALGKSNEEAVAVAASIVLPPGTSEHQTGLAVDIVTPENQNLDESFAQTPAAKWLAENSWKYGFILRYPKDKQEITNIIYEPWHFRYVGQEHAKAIYEGGYCLEEYLYGVLNQKRLESFVFSPTAGQSQEAEERQSEPETEEKEQ
ncbi:MAG: M15 family metallopeptidase [Oscillospiraceae bacterium]|jgi:D-alanyl-D-alanine carboxypeptidase